MSKENAKRTIYLVLHEFTPMLIILLVLLTDQITSRAVYGDGQIKLKGLATFKKVRTRYRPTIELILS